MEDVFAAVCAGTARMSDLFDDPAPGELLIFHDGCEMTPGSSVVGVVRQVVETPQPVDFA